MRKWVWMIVFAALGIAMLIAVSTPRLMQSKVSMARHESSGYLALQDSTSSGSVTNAKRNVTFALGPGVVFAEDQMVVRKAKLDLITREVRASVDQVRAVTQRFGGFIEKADFSDTGNGLTSADMIVRVPKAHLDEALAAFKSAGIRVENESVEATDVTREWVDTQARVRNLKAEEDQYLTILKRAAKVQDTLDVAEKLSGVRGEIERLQADLNYLSHQVEMSSITINVRQQPPVVVAGWHPGENAREAWNTLVSGLTAMVDFLVTVLIVMPLVLLWGVMFGVAAWLIWRIAKIVRRHWPNTSEPTPTPAG